MSVRIVSTITLSLLKTKFICISENQSNNRLESIWEFPMRLINFYLLKSFIFKKFIKNINNYFYI